jgi:hyperosmotically inducible protein
VDDLTVGHKSFGESVDDAVIVTKVKAKITADVDINPFDIDVGSNKGIVTLSGRVDTEAQRDKAGRLARDTEGVRGVENLIKVGDLRK